MVNSYNKMKFLVVDDNDRMRQGTRNMLERIGCDNITDVGDLSTATYMIQNRIFDVIICEAIMDEVSGVELLRILRENDENQNAIFILIAGSGDHDTIAEAAEEDVDAYIIRPITALIIQNKIEQVLSARRSPAPLKIHLDLGMVYLNSGQLEKAMNEFQKAISINPNSPRVLFAIAKVLEQRGDIKEAQKLYHKAVDISPQFIKGHDALACLYESQDDMEAAARHLEQAATVSPRNLERQIRLAKNMIKTGSKNKARDILTLVMESAKNNYSNLARQVGDAYMEADMAAEAQNVLVQGLSSNPTDLHLFNRLGIAYRKQKKFSEATKNYEQAIKIDPDNENLYYNLGRACYDAKNWDKAATAMKKALELRPDFKEAEDFLKNVLKI